MKSLTIVVNTVSLWLAIPGLALAANPGRPEWKNLDDMLTSGNLKPKGKSYDATVPDTLDLAERARLSVHGLTSFLNPTQNYSPYHQAWFNVRQPLMTSRMVFGQSDNAGVANWGKIAAALILTRSMSGSEENLEIESKTLKGMVAFTPEEPGSWGWNPTTFIILALMDLNQRTPNPRIMQFIARLVKAYHAGAEHVDDRRAYYKLNVEPVFSDGPAGQYGYGAHVRTQGDSIRMLTRWYEMSGDRESLKLASRLVNYVIENQPYWVPEADPKAVVGSERAHFSGHPHEYAHCLMGILGYARATNDARLKQFVRDGYEYLRNFGIARIGLFGETCATADMVCLAVNLSDAGVGDYWEDVDQYVRNILADRQITDVEKLRRAVELPPVLSRPVRQGDPSPRNARWSPMGQCYDADWNAQVPLDPKLETVDNVIGRNVGCFFSDSADPSEIPKHRFMWNICCPGNGNQALYWAWESIVRCKHGAAQVHLLLNRASPWLDLDSYLPYAGKVVIRNKLSKNIAVRIPRWVDKKAVYAERGGKPASPFWIDNNLTFSNLKAGEIITINFPVVETEEKYTLKWKKSDWWMEGTNPGSTWKNDHPTQYTLRFRGNTMVDLKPRPANAAYPSFCPIDCNKPQTPMVCVRRFVPSQ
jgi:hypothetical protein